MHAARVTRDLHNCSSTSLSRCAPPHYLYTRHIAPERGESSKRRTYAWTEAPMTRRTKIALMRKHLRTERTSMSSLSTACFPRFIYFHFINYHSVCVPLKPVERISFNERIRRDLDSVEQFYLARVQRSRDFAESNSRHVRHCVIFMLRYRVYIETHIAFPHFVPKYKICFEKCDIHNDLRLEIPIRNLFLQFILVKEFSRNLENANVMKRRLKV